MSLQTTRGLIKPDINVTPLIDVLLVLLIIFMVVTPLKPARFKALIPEQPRNDAVPPEPNPLTLVVTIENDGSLKLNQLEGMGSVEDMGKLNMELVKLFEKRRVKHTYSPEMLNRIDAAEHDRVEKTVFIKAPRSIRYGEVAKVIDGIKGAGANPVGLQIDDLN